MKVILLRYTPDGVKLIAESCRVSGVPSSFKDGEIINMVVNNDYSSVLEHISFTFDIRDISIALSRELLEHRVASHTARSTRYQDETDFNYYIPPEFKKNKKALKLYQNVIESQRKAYRELGNMKISKESSRYVMPMSAHTNYILSINTRSLINFLGLRLCIRASPEMRELADKLYGTVVELYPEIFSNLGCRGINMSVCPENDIRDSEQGKGCPYRVVGSKLYIPTKDKIRNTKY